MNKYLPTSSMAPLAVFCLLSSLWLIGCPRSQVTMLEKVAVYDIDVPEPSGLAINRAGTYLYAVSDRKGKVYQLDTKGQRLGSFEVKARDYEGIALDQDADQFYLLDEEDNRIIVTDRQGETLRKINLPWKSKDNSGPEALELSQEGDRLFIMNEKSPTMLYVCDLEGKMLSSREITALSDASAITVMPSTGDLLIVSDQDQAILRTNLNGSKSFIQHIDMTKPEGIAIDESKRYIYLVSDEEEELHVYKY